MHNETHDRRQFTIDLPAAKQALPFPVHPASDLMEAIAGVPCAGCRRRLCVSCVIF